MNNYPYANGVIKSIENTLFDRSKLFKLTSEEHSEIINTLLDMNYGQETDSLETLIYFEMIKVKNLINELTPDKTLTDLFFLSLDVQNIKVLYKVKYFDLALDEETIKKRLVATGSFNNDNLIDLILNDNTNSDNKLLLRLINTINTSLTDEDKINPRLLSTKIDNCIYQYAKKNAKASKALLTYFTTTIDFTNFITFIRSHNLEWPCSRFEEMFINGGSIKKTFFINNYQIYQEPKMQDSFLKHLNEYYEEKITKIIIHYLEKKNLNRLEKDFDSLLINIMSQYKNDAFDIGPMIYYYLEKTAEAKNIRMIYANRFIDINDLIEY